MVFDTQATSGVPSRYHERLRFLRSSYLPSTCRHQVTLCIENGKLFFQNSEHGDSSLSRYSSQWHERCKDSRQFPYQVTDSRNPRIPAAVAGRREALYVRLSVRFAKRSIGRARCAISPLSKPRRLRRTLSLISAGRGRGPV